MMKIRKMRVGAKLILGESDHDTKRRMPRW
jgi:hypothetical protein